MSNWYRVCLSNSTNSDMRTRMRIRKYADCRKLYATHRMSTAIDRMIIADTAEEKRQAARWAMAWCVVSGKPPSTTALE